MLRTHTIAHLVEEVEYPLGRLPRLLTEGIEHEKHPPLPRLLAGYRKEQLVVRRTVSIDVAAYVENGKLEQPRMNKMKDDENPPGTTVSVGKGMNCLELIVLKRALHKRLDEYVT